jgi:XTP/dITP diphosphohydrolase
MKLVFATHNKNKFEEINDILKNRFELLCLDDIGCTEEIPEEEPTLEGNARLKALYVFRKYSNNCFADDTGLEVFSLNGAPGVHSARYSGNSFASEKERSDSNIEKLWKQLQGKQDKSARFRTIISYIADGKEMQFEGEVQGKIINEKKGTNGFGYDPVFVPDGFTKTFAEMTLQEKSEISHRARAFKKFTDHLMSK